MKISRRDWNEYSEMLAELSRLASDEMQTFLESHGIENTELIVDVAHALVTKYGEASAAAACNLYDEIAEKQGKAVRSAEPAETASREKTAGAVYGSLKDSPEGRKLKQIPDRLVKQAAADTMLQNAKRDGAEWAWIPSGDGCAMCMTIASRGWLPASSAQLSGGHASHIHANCKCQFAIRFDKNLSVEGYDPDELKRQYDAAEGSGSRQKINYLRRKRYEKNRKLKQEVNGEKERAYIHDKGKPGICHVNTSLVNTAKYHEKYEGLTPHKKANESLYNEAMQILDDRNNTNFESIVAIDSRSGDRIMKNDNGALLGIPESCGFTKEEEYALEHRGSNYEVLHNHPSSSFPSRDDIRIMFKRQHQSGSTISCHNGDVYRLEKLKQYEDIDEFEKNIYTKVKEKFSDYPDEKIEYECSLQMIKTLTKAGYMNFTSR